MFSCSVMGLILTSIFVLMGLFFPGARAAGALPLFTPNPVTGGEQQRFEHSYLNLPVFRHFRKPRVDKRHFAPAHVKNRESLPERVLQVLVPAPRRRLKTRVKLSDPVSVTCSPTEMRVRVQTAHLGEGMERVHVRLGTCDVSSSTGQSVLFQYELQQCDTQRQILNNTIVYSNILHFTPGAWGSEVFSIPVQCRFNRFHYSYKIGFLPSVENLKFFKPMKMKGSVTLTACDAQWNRLPPDEGFVTGQPMFFEAETLYVPDDKRLFIHFCHVTANSSRVSAPQVNIINNYGCLIISQRSSQSRFINSSRRNIVRFTIDAFTLRGKVQNYLFIHCEMSIKSVVPTETSKSCTYNQLERRWEELYGADSVCSCCDSSCVPEMPTLMRPMTSELWALMKQNPEGMSRNGSTQSTKGISTLELEQGILATEVQHKATVQEETRTLEQKHTTATTERIPTLETMHVRTFTLEDKHRTLVPDGEYGIISLEDMHMPERSHVLATQERDHATPTPESDHGMLTPKSDHAMPTIEVNHAIPESSHGTATPENGHAMATTKSDHSMPMPEGDHAMPTPKGDHWTLTESTYETLKPKINHRMITTASTPTPGTEHRTVLPDSEHGTLKPERKHGEVALEAPPMLEPLTILENEHRTPIPDTDRVNLPLHPDEAVSPGAEYKNSELQEPYRIFEEVFGLS